MNESLHIEGIAIGITISRFVKDSFIWKISILEEE